MTNTNVKIKTGASTDYAEAKSLIYESSHELLNFMFATRETAESVLGKLYQKSRGHFSHVFSTVAVQNERVVGVQLGYDQDQLAKQDLNGSILLLISSPASRWWHLITKTGPVLSKYIPKPSTGTYYINNIAVSSRCRGGGIGKQLLFHTLNAAKEKGYKGVELDVTSVNGGAIGFYKAHGFMAESESGNAQLHKLYGLPPLIRMRHQF